MTPKLGRHALLFIFITVALDTTTMGTIIPVLPRLIASFTGENLAHAAWWIGILTTVWAFMQFFCAPLLGMLSDRHGRRPVILLSNAVRAIDSAIMALAPNLGWLLFGRILSGATSANVTTAYAYIADVAPPERRAASYGLIGAAFGLGFVIGPALGGLAGAHDPRLPFWIASAFGLLNTLYGAFVMPESLPHSARHAALDWRRANPLGSLRLLRSHHELYGLATVTFLFTIAQLAVPTLWVIYLMARFDWSPSTIGVTLALVGLMTAFTAGVLVGPAVKLLGERRTLLVGIAIYALGNLLFASANLAICMTGTALMCLAIFNSPARSLMSQRVGPSEQGELQGALGSVQGITMLFAPGLFAALFAQVDGPWHAYHLLGTPFVLAALMLVVAFIVAVAAARTARATSALQEAPLPPAATEVPL